MGQSEKNNFCLSIIDLGQALSIAVPELKKGFEKICGPQKSWAHLDPQAVRKYLYSKGYRFPHQVISFQMLKGGVAKTTSALNFGIRAAMYGAKVLFVDLDQQANLTYALGVESENLPVWVDILEKKNSIQGARITIDQGIDLIPSSLNNSVLDRVLLSGQKNWAGAVKNYLKEIQSEYDFIIIDTAPNLSAINTAVTCASDLVILPINPDKFSLIGVRKHLADLEDLRKDFDLDFEEKILFTRFDGRESSSAQILELCLQEFQEKLMLNYIRTSSDIKNTIASSKTIYSTKSNAKEDYDLVTRELMEFEKCRQ